MRTLATLSPGHLLTLWIAIVVLWLGTIWYTLDSRAADASAKAALTERTALDQADAQRAQLSARVYADSHAAVATLLVESQFRGYAGAVLSLQRDLRRLSQQREFADSAAASSTRLLAIDQSTSVASLRELAARRGKLRMLSAGVASLLSLMVIATTWRWFSLRGRAMLPPQERQRHAVR